jgi:hypothetical protein
LSFSKLLNLTAVLGLLSLTIITSLNVDAMVARHNISKFKENVENLDKQALRQLSIDALPVIKEYSINLDNNHTTLWYVENRRKSCKDFGHYHLGYCSKLLE